MTSKHGCVFVGGPIQHAIARDGTFDRRARSAIASAIAALESGGHRVLSAHVFEQFGKMDMAGLFREVCQRDYAWMRQCDAFVAVLPLDSRGEVIHSGGTSVELGWASALGKPIVLVCDPAPRYSHLVLGLDAVARVVHLDINAPDLPAALCAAVGSLLAEAQAGGMRTTVAS
jgi:nucleoside 2-deoxyribosyltransferase